LTDHVLEDARSLGVEGLAGVLVDVLGDPLLRVTLLQPGAGADPGNGAVLTVMDGSRAVALVHHGGDSLSDPATAAAVAEAVRLVVADVERREELDRRLGELRAARERVVSATDHQRAVTAGVLRAGVVRPLERAVASLSEAADEITESTAAAAVAVAAHEMSAAARDVDALVAGAPPVVLGRGRLVKALEDLLRRSPLPVDMTVTGGIEAHPAVEGALFFVCSEALVNAYKHSNAHHLSVTLEASAEGALLLTVADDGVGGANPGGGGLRGLAERMALVGGRLDVVSPRGRGTRVTASCESQPMRRQGEMGQ
jgi:signal transduction histidine kinase